ncbi:hypothetical protein V6N11_080763 [Hibiscus sabdariffa]|uniref:Uncharacterized protein n=1 Tax=Hibiscus sabdariffa TaxID=183260 RepID=A0ABR2QI87_9ROSI
MRNRRASVDTAVVDVWQRELGELSNRKFALRLAASEDLVLRLEIFKKLEKHRDDRSLITCAADGQVRHAQLLERGVETRQLAKHERRAHKLAIEPGSPHIFYTCGEDGLVQHIDLRTATATELFTCLPIDDSKAYMPIWTPNAIDKSVLPTNIEQVPKRGLFRLLPFAAFYEDDDDDDDDIGDDFLGGCVVEYSDDNVEEEEEEDDDDDSDDDFLDVYDDIDEDEDDDNDGDGDDGNDGQGNNPEENEENASAVGRELLDLILAFVANSDDASDDGGNGPEHSSC